MVSVTNKGLFMLRDKVAGKSKGKLLIDILGSTEVVDAFDLGTATKNEVIDLAYCFAAGFSTYVPACRGDSTLACNWRW